MSRFNATYFLEQHADAERRRTAEDELAEARAEIARLKGEHEDGAA